MSKSDCWFDTHVFGRVVGPDEDTIKTDVRFDADGRYIGLKRDEAFVDVEHLWTTQVIG